MSVRTVRGIFIELLSTIKRIFPPLGAYAGLYWIPIVLFRCLSKTMTCVKVDDLCNYFLSKGSAVPS